MAQYRQSGGLHHPNGSPDHLSIGVRGSSHPHKPSRIRRFTRSDKSNRFNLSIASLIIFSCLILLLTLFAYYFLSSYSNTNKDNIRDGGIVDDDLYFLTNVSRTDTVKVLGFGKGSGIHGRDSRYWDRDDRRRDDDYDEDHVAHVAGKVVGNESVTEERKNWRDESSKSLDQRGVGLYNEDGRKELRMYEEEYEASLKNGGMFRRGDGAKSQLLEDEDNEERREVVDMDNEYDDGIDFHDAHMDDFGGPKNGRVEHSDDGLSNDEDDEGSSNFLDAEMKPRDIGNDVEEDSVDLLDKGYSNSKILDKRNAHPQHVRVVNDQSMTKSRSDSKKKSKRRKFSGSSCEMKFLNSTSKLVEPFESRKFARFSLQYVEMEQKPNGQQQSEPRFGGHQSLAEREESFVAHDQKIKCGFIKGPEGSHSAGFDLSEDDSNYISRCHIAVVSCIFGNSDRLRSPAVKMVTRLSRKNVCFVMFVDQITLQTLSSEGHTPDREGFIGLWKIVVVKNLPYSDMRRVGKIPKLLPHRLFPSARYSMWLDSKLRLQLDPLLVLEYLLWRKGHEYAISNHYDRHCVWEEVAQNKRLNKYNHTVIDQQFAFYRSDELKRFNASDINRLLPSNVPEGSLIVRAHTPMSNLFSCLWFNEIDRFTPRDQLSFAYTYHKLRRMNLEKPFYLNMFKDCERRQIAKLFRHRSEEKRNILRQAAE